MGVVALEVDQPELEFLSYREDQLVLLAPLENLFGGESTISFVDCTDQPFISLRSGVALHTLLVDHASALGRCLDVCVQKSGYRAIARLVVPPAQECIAS